MAFWKKRGKADEKAPTQTSESSAAESSDVDAAAAEDSDVAEKDDADAPDAEKDSAEKDSDAAQDSDAADSVDDKPSAEKDSDEKDSDDADAEKDSDDEDVAEKDSAEKDGDSDEDDDSDDEAAAKKDPDDDEEVDEFWEKAEIDPVEISLPSGTGYTLRHYRTVTDEDDEEAEEAVFIAHDRKVQMFRSAEDLVEYVKGDAEHDLRELETYAEMAEGLTAERVVADEEDEYGLDLVVQNLRGGHDAWDQDLLIGAGEITRDIAFACQLDDVLTALAPGSPLDDLDEALRANGFLARRKMRKISPERAAIAWRSLISKVDAVIEWHGEIPEDDEDEDDSSDDADAIEADDDTASSDADSTDDDTSDGDDSSDEDATDDDSSDDASADKDTSAAHDSPADQDASTDEDKDEPADEKPAASTTRKRRGRTR